MPDEFGLTQEDYDEQARRRMVLDMQKRFPKISERRGNTMKLIAIVVGAIAVAAVILGTVAARADGYIKTPHGEYRFGYDADFPSKIIVVPRIETDATRERDASWVRDCKITFDMDAFGVKHYNFSQGPSGCKFGYLPSEQ